MELPQRYQLDPGAGVGRGRVVQVRTGVDRQRSIPVAIGVLRGDLPDRAALVARFDAEVTQTAFVSHAAWWPRHDHGRTRDGLPFVVAPLASSSFAEYRARPPQWDELSRLLLDVVDGLAWLHARGRVHGNLKPEDLLLWVDADGRLAARLADPHLGGVVARVLGRRHPPGAPGYAAPEQRRDRPVARGADLFSLGAIVWEVVTGARPFAGDPLDAPLPSFEPRFPVPPRLHTVLANLLHPNPLGRYDLAADLRTELSALGPPAAGVAGAGEGTVAPAFVAPRQVATDETLDEVSFRGMTADEVLSLPPWNRPLPPPMPAAPPPDRLDVDAPCASIAVRAAREIPPIGRGAAREALWTAAREVADRRAAGVVVVHGPAGVGRTSTIRAVTTALEQAGHAETVWCGYAADSADQGLWGAARALLEPGSDPRDVLTATFRRRLMRERSTGGRNVPAEAALLARWCGPLGPGEPAAPIGVGCYEVLRRAEARSWRGLSVIVLDDVHLSTHDDGLALAERLLDRARDGQSVGPLLVVVSVVDDALAGDLGLRGRIDRLLRSGARDLPLNPGGPVTTDAIVAARAPLTAEARVRVVAACEDRLWRVPQVLCAWDEAELLSWDDAWSTTTSAGGPALDPVTVRDRVDRMAERSGVPRRFLDTAHLLALAGRAVPWAVVESVAGAAGVDAVLACDLWTVGHDALTFASDEVREWLRADALGRPDLRYLHRRLSRAWDRACRERDHGLHAAEHASIAGDPVFAVALASRAAELGWRSGVPSLTAAAAALLARLDAGGLAALWQGRSDESRFDFAAAAEQYEAARVALDAAGDAPRGLEAALGVAGCRLALGEVDAADWLYAEIVDQARQRELLRPEAHAMAGRALAAERKRAYDDAEQIWGRVVARSARLADLRFAGESLFGEAEVARRTGHFDDAEELYHEAATAFRDGLDPVGEIRCQLGVHTATRHQRPDAEVEGKIVGLLDALDAYGANGLWTHTWIGLADLSRHRDDLDRAALRYDIASEWTERAGSFELVVHLALGRAQLALAHGDLAGAYEQTRRAAAGLDQRPGHPLWGPYRLVVATLLAHRRDHTQTWQWLWSAQEVGVADTVDRDAASCLAQICEIAAEAGWGNVLRLAGKLGAEQFERLQDEARAIRLQQRVANALL